MKSNRIYDLLADGGPVTLHMTSADISNGGLDLFLGTQGERRIHIDPDGDVLISGYPRSEDDEKLGT